MGMMPRGAIPPQLVLYPWLQPPSSWDAARLLPRSSRDETQLSSSPTSSSPVNADVTLPGAGVPPCAPRYHQGGEDEPAAAPCRWLPGWLWCHWDAPRGLAAPGSGCPAEPRPQCSSGGWRDKLGAKGKGRDITKLILAPRSYLGEEHHQELRELRHAEDKHGGRGVNHICLLFVQGPWTLRTQDLEAVGHGTPPLSAPSHPHGTHQSRDGKLWWHHMGMGSPCPHALTRSSSLDSISMGPLGPGGPGGPCVTMTTLVTVAAAPEPTAMLTAPPMVPSAACPHAMAPTACGSKGPVFWHEGHWGPHLLAALVHPWVLAALGSLSAPAKGGGGGGKRSKGCDAAVWSCTSGYPMGPPRTSGTGQEGRVPMAGLSPAPSAPLYSLWVQTSPGREGQGPGKREAGGIKAPSQRDAIPVGEQTPNPMGG